MRIEHALRIRDVALLSLKDVFSVGQISGSLSSTIESNRREVLERTKKAPQWVRAYLDGYWRAMVDHAYRYDLVYGGFIGDKFYSTHNDRADYYERHGIEPREYADDGKVTRRGHYWKANGRPFFIG